MNLLPLWFYFHCDYHNFYSTSMSSSLLIHHIHHIHYYCNCFFSWQLLKDCTIIVLINSVFIIIIIIKTIFWWMWPNATLKSICFGLVLVVISWRGSLVLVSAGLPLTSCFCQHFQKNSYYIEFFCMTIMVIIVIIMLTNRNDVLYRSLLSLSLFFLLHLLLYDLSTLFYGFFFPQFLIHLSCSLLLPSFCCVFNLL